MSNISGPFWERRAKKRGDKTPLYGWPLKAERGCPEKEDRHCRDDRYDKPHEPQVHYVPFDPVGVKLSGRPGLFVKPRPMQQMKVPNAMDCCHNITPSYLKYNPFLI